MRVAEGVVSSYSMISLRELMTAVFKERRRILISMAVTFGLGIVIALCITPKYEATSSLLVLLGPEYGFRSTAGEPSAVNASLAREEFLRSEVEILNSETLQEDVMRKIGLANIYPSYAEGPGIFSRIGSGFSAIGRFITGKPASPPVDPVIYAEPEFAANFGADALKEGSVIEVTFKHKDPQMAALALNTLISIYLQERSRLYADIQSTMIGDQVKIQRKQLDELDEKTAAFKAANGAYNYDMQRDILLHQRGDIQNDITDAQRAIAQARQRVAVLGSRLAGTPVNQIQYADTDVDSRLDDLRTTLNGLNKDLADRRMRYQENSLMVREVKDEVADISARIEKTKNDKTSSISRVGRNPNYDSLEMDRIHAEADLQSGMARLASDQQQLIKVNAETARLNAKETELSQFERQRAVADADYRDAVKQYSDRNLLEDVQQRKTANVRVIQPAVPPLKPVPLRRLIALGGLLLSFFVGAAVVFIAELMRTSYFSPEQIERSLGLSVLVTIPDRAVLAGGGRYLAMPRQNAE